MLFVVSAYSQSCTISFISLRPDNHYFNTQAYTINYPVIHISDSIVSLKINQAIRKELLLEDQPGQSLIAELKKMIHDGYLISMDDSVTFNKNGIVSMYVTVEGCGAYCATSRYYFNFDLNNGETIPINNIIKKDSFADFKADAFKIKVAGLNGYKKEIKAGLANKEIDSDEYNEVIQYVDEWCIDSVDVANFSLTTSHIEIIDNCAFPHVMQNLTPDYNLIFPFESIKKFISTKYWNKLGASKQ